MQFNDSFGAKIQIRLHCLQLCKILMLLMRSPSRQRKRNVKQRLWISFLISIWRIFVNFLWHRFPVIFNFNCLFCLQLQGTKSISKQTFLASVLFSRCRSSDNTPLRKLFVSNSFIFTSICTHNLWKDSWGKFPWDPH